MERESVGDMILPGIGLGTLGSTDEVGATMVDAALAEGYRYIDTARYYGNEDAVGRGLERSSVARGDVSLTTKLLHPKSSPMTDLAAELEESLRRLRTDYVDLLLIHWPSPEVSLGWALQEFVALREAGKARAIGISNFPSALMTEALGIVPDLANNQVEYHVYLHQERVLEVVREHGMLLTAHTPLARGAVVEDELLLEIAAGHGVGVSQVALRWVIQHERVVAIPGARNVEHLRENLRTLAFTLSEDEMRAIDGLGRGQRIVDPPHGPEWDPA